MLDTAGSLNKRKNTSKGIGLAITVGLGLLAVGGTVLAFAGGGGDSPSGSVADLIPTGPITDAERDACEQVLGLKPQPTTYADDQGRVWTPCVDWWLGKAIPNWPGGPWPGQVPFLHKPVDAAEWLGCIAGYLVYKGPLTQAITDPAIFKNEALTVEITKKLSARRDVLRAYMMQRLGELGRANAVTNCDPPPPNIDPVDPDPKPDPKPDPPPPPPPAGSLEFDLSTNWGGIPMALRKELARIELAAQLPGLARTGAVKAWQAYRALQPYVTTAEAAAIAAAHPELCRLCFNAGDAAASKKLLDLNINGPNHWPTPLDYKGWAAGSYGLFDILGATAVYAGIHTDSPAEKLPLMQMASAAEAMKRYDVQGFALSYIVRRILVSTKYKVLKPGANAPAATQDSYQTWGNIFSAYAGPDNYAKGNQASIDAKTRYLARAKEIGIDLAKVAYPWPPGAVYKAPTWTAGQVWARLQDYKDRDVVDTEGGGGEGGGQDPDPDPDEDTLTNLAGGLKARIVTVGANKNPPTLLVVLHGRDADETQLANALPAGIEARVAFVRAPIAGDDNTYRWYEALSSAPAQQLGDEIRESADQVATAIAELSLEFSPTKLYVLGYSQGASVAYDLAARGLVNGVVIVAGYYPPTLFPQGQSATMVWAVHGSADKNISPAKGQEAYTAMIGHAQPKGIKMVLNGTHALTTLKDGLQAAVKSLPVK
jgi:predicted esterase